MQIQPITHQPNFNGKLVIRTGKSDSATPFLNDKLLETKFKNIATILQDKPYDLFIFQNKQNPDFYNVAANKSLKEAKKVKEYTVKIQKNIMLTSIIDAAKDAMEMYEKYISKSIKR